MKQQQGFTLVELIIVIVILGILAVTAAPRFIDIQTDARKETIQGVKAAIQGASQLVYAKAAIGGVQKADPGSVTIQNQTVATRFGYPSADTITSAATVQAFVDIDLSGDLTIENASAADNKFRIRFTSIASDDTATPATGCYVEYVGATAIGETPTITVLDNAC